MIFYPPEKFPPILNPRLGNRPVSSCPQRVWKAVATGQAQPAFVLPGMAWGDIVYLIMEITKEFGPLRGVFLARQICLQIPLLAE